MSRYNNRAQRPGCKSIIFLPITILYYLVFFLAFL